MSAARKKTVARVSRNKTMPSTLGDTPIIVRTLRGVGGLRPDCKFTKKRNRMARKAGFLDSRSSEEALRKVAASGDRS